MRRQFNVRGCGISHVKVFLGLSDLTEAPDVQLYSECAPSTLDEDGVEGDAERFEGVKRREDGKVDRQYWQ